MKRNRIKLIRMSLRMCLLGLCLATAAGAGLVPPLYVGNLDPVLDQYGRVMPGSHLMDQSNERSLVEIRTSTDDYIRPPLTSGAAHPFNPLLSDDSVGGVGLNSSTPDSGLFCMVLEDRPAAGTKLFVRAYNAPTAEEATFYADSLMMDVPAYANSLVVTFREARPLDSGDDDGDGLVNSWEEVMGTYGVDTADFDGDGMSDLHEMLAGTDATDAESNLSFKFIRRDVALQTSGETGGQDWEKPVRVRWKSIPGKTYRLYHVPMLLAEDPATGEPYAFELAAEVTAEADEYEIEMLVDVPEGDDTGMFKVCVVTEE